MTHHDMPFSPMLTSETIPVRLKVSSAVLDRLGKHKDPMKRINAALKKSLGVTLEEFVNVTLTDCANDTQK
jgi:hypothetical protein